MVKWNFIETLLSFSSKSPEELERIRDRVIVLETNWNEFAEIEYYEIVEDLLNSQVDKISNGLSYNQTDILRHLRKLE